VIARSPLGGGGDTAAGGRWAMKPSVRLHESQITRRDGSTSLVREGMDLALHQIRLKPFLAAALSPRRRC
jgi:hypothetical protein